MASQVIKVASKVSPAKQTMIIYHGLGDSGHGWSFLAEYFQRDSKFAHTKFIFPNAPIVPVTVSGGQRMPAWFDILDWNLESPNSDSEGFLRSLKDVEKVVKQEIESGIDPKNIIVGGFSQGAALALASAVTLPFKIGGFLVLSGFAVAPKVIESANKRANTMTPIFHGHGEIDPVVPFQVGARSKDFYMKQCGLQNYTFHKYSGLEHSTSPEEMTDIITFTKNVFELK